MRSIQIIIVNMEIAKTSSRGIFYSRHIL
jgi:hypothetical protein